MTTDQEPLGPRLDDVLIVNDSLPSNLGRRRDVWRLLAAGHDQLSGVTNYAKAERVGRRLARERSVTLWRAPVPGRSEKQLVADFRPQPAEPSTDESASDNGRPIRRTEQK
jgi:hypothetical protein